MESKNTRKLIYSVKLGLLMLAVATCFFMGLYGIGYIGTVHIVLAGWLFCLGFTVGYFVLFFFFVLVAIWWTDIDGWWSDNTA